MVSLLLAGLLAPSLNPSHGSVTCKLVRAGSVRLPSDAEYWSVSPDGLSVAIAETLDSGKMKVSVVTIAIGSKQSVAVLDDRIRHLAWSPAADRIGICAETA